MFTPEKNFEDWSIGGFAGVAAYLFKTIDSTHSYMRRQALAGQVKPGSLVVADCQSAGRGRHDRTWASPEGKNLYFNLLIPLEGIPLGSTPQLTQVAALTFAEIFRGLEPSINNNCSPEPRQTQGTHVTVKWPNDILYGKSKFCGILAEVVPVPIPALNLGVGVNVNSDPGEYGFLNRSVTTLKSIAGRPVNREKLLQALVGNLERALGQFKAFGISPWVDSWRKMDQFIGTRGTLVINNNCTDENRNSGEGSLKKAGVILDMNPDGSLLFKTDEGEIRTVYSADLEI